MSALSLTFEVEIDAFSLAVAGGPPPETRRWFSPGWGDGSLGRGGGPLHVSTISTLEESRV